MEWIDIEEQEPETDEEFLVLTQDGVRTVAKYWLTIGKWLCSDVRVAQGIRVTHWAHLPEVIKKA